jgi:hypothetical protein
MFETCRRQEELNLGFVVSCIFNNSNKTPNQKQQSIVKFYCFVVQTLLNMFRELQCSSAGARQTAVAASGFRMNVEVEVFSAVVGLLVTNKLNNKPTTAENTSTSTFIRKPEAATAVCRALDDEHCNARNMLSSVCTTK